MSLRADPATAAGRPYFKLSLETRHWVSSAVSRIERLGSTFRGELDNTREAGAFSVTRGFMGAEHMTRFKVIAVTAGARTATAGVRNGCSPA